MVDREKRWLKEKGCKNVARMWRADLGMWTIVPMREGKEFHYETPVWEPREVALGKMKKITFKMSDSQKARWQSSQPQKSHKEKQ